jgi:predicted TPR repeat methyltransferase
MKPVSLIIAADSYIYFGDLVPLFKSMEEGLEDGGFAAFTLEGVSEENGKRCVFYLSCGAAFDELLCYQVAV